MTTVKRTVLVDTYAYMTPVGDERLGRFLHNIARRGETIEISTEEAARGESLDALGTEAQAAAAAFAAAEPGVASDEELRGKNVDELSAYLGQHPSEAERIAALEDARDRPRGSILKAVERVITTRDEALASSGAPAGE